MNNNELNKKLNELKNEDYIWIVYIGIIFASWYANTLERKYYTDNDVISKNKYRSVIIKIFVVLVVVYLYFLKESLDDIRKLKPNDSEQKKRLVTLSFIGTLFIAFSGFIFLYIALEDQDLNVELAFN